MIARSGRFLLIPFLIAPLTLTAAARHPGWLGLGYTFNSSGTGSAASAWLFVQGVMPSGPAAKAGVRPHDVITKIKGRPITFKNDIEALDFFGTLNVGDRIVFGIRRGTRSLTLSVVATAIPPTMLNRRELNRALAQNPAHN